eukprot:3941832-Rhodomonas_salina.1
MFWGRLVPGKGFLDVRFWGRLVPGASRPLRSFPLTLSTSSPICLRPSPNPLRTAQIRAKEAKSSQNTPRIRAQEPQSTHHTSQIHVQQPEFGFASRRAVPHSPCAIAA